MSPVSDNHDEEFARLSDEFDGSITKALEQLPMPIWIAARDGRIRWLNLEARNVLGSVQGSHFSRVIAPESLNDVRGSFARKILGGSDLSVRRTTLIGTAGRIEAEVASVSIEIDSYVVGILTFAHVGPVPPQPSGKQPPPRLTPRQHEVLELLAQGHSTTRIAAELQIADETARNHVRLLLAELGVHTRLEAVVVAFRNGWL
jgi:DNA-binding CsgD family transcriptional regulator